MTTRQHTKIVLAFIMFTLIHCGAAGTRVGNPPSQFPSNLSITSPLETTDSSATSSLVTETSLWASTSSFSSTNTAISNILNGTSITDCTFDLSEITQAETDAECYGPAVDYENHPGAATPNSGQLPTGDVGMWTANDSETSNACAAAQLNSRLESTKKRSLAALSALASLICTSNVNGLSLPTDGESVDRTTAMNSMLTSNGVTGTELQSATLSLSGSTYSYALEVLTTIESQQLELKISMQHEPLDNEGSTYRGKFSYQFPLSSFGGNCPTSDTTEAGSVLYQLSSETDLQYRVDSGSYCGDVENPFTDNGLLDKSDAYEAASNPDGWGNNFSEFTANFNPLTLAGDYTYSWQAGALDDNSRVFNVNLSAESDLISGEAFFGFGPSITTESFDGGIDGFICNWAGPGNDHTVLDFVQYQSLEQNSDGTFSATTSNITYAPTNSCEYDASSGGGFVFDQDGDGTIESPSSDVANGLETVSTYQNSVFELPTSPSNF